MLFYFFSLLLVYSYFKNVVKDQVYSRFVLPISVNICYIVTYLLVSPTPKVVQNMGDLLVSHYVIDTGICYRSKDDGRWIYIIHHVITILLLKAHLWNILPLSFGITYLTLFEFSNTFLYMYQLCQKKRWVYLQHHVIVYPFVVSYVPLRLVAIPLYSLNYFSADMGYYSKMFSFILIGFVNLFSMFFGGVVAYKFIKHTIHKLNRNQVRQTT
jgi:hypothetical protein